MNNQSFKDFATDLSAGVAFMEEREKGDSNKILGDVITIRDYDYLVDPKKLSELKDGEDPKKAEYVVFIIEEDDKHFFFGGKLLTEDMRKMDAGGFKPNVQNEGLPTLLEKIIKKTDSKQSFVKPTFFPEVKK